MTLRLFDLLRPGWFTKGKQEPVPSISAPSVYENPDGSPRCDYEGHAMACAPAAPVTPPFLEFDADIADEHESPFLLAQQAAAALSDDDVWERRDPADDKGVEYE